MLGPIASPAQSRALALTKTAAGTLTLSGANTYNGITTISAGTLQIGNSGTSGTPGSGNITDNAALSFSRTDNALVVASIISGTGTVSQIGSGTTTLSAANSYSGLTTVSSGTLLVNGSQPGSALTVNSGATLGGTNGKIGAVSVPGGTVSPGAASAGSGILNSGNVNFSSTAALNVDLDGTIAGTGYDQLNVTGTVNLGTSTKLNVTLGTGFTPVPGNTFTIIQSSSAISGTFTSLAEGTLFSANGQFFQISYKNDDVSLTCIAVTTTAVSSSLNPSVYGQSVTFTATVSDASNSAVPTGSLEFFDGSTDLGSGTSLSGSGTSATSTFTISTLTAGAHSISAVYSATGIFQGSTSSPVNQTVTPAG